MSSLTFGRYVPYNTYVHRLDPRTKILLTILAMVTFFLTFNKWSTSLIFAGIYLILIIIVMLTSKVSVLSLFKSLAGMWFLLIFLLAIYIFVPNSSYTHVMVDFNNGYKLYYDAFYQAGFIILRLVLMIGITMVLTTTTKPFDLTDGFEWYLTPLKLVKFPVHILAMMTSIALRFIPTILDETSRIMKAQESRGVDFNKGGLAKKFKALISLIIPLFVSSFERSEQLANAMEARGYDPNAKRSRYRKLSFHLGDLFAVLIVGAIFGFILYLTIAHKDLDIIKLIFNVECGF